MTDLLEIARGLIEHNRQLAREASTEEMAAGFRSWIAEKEALSKDELRAWAARTLMNTPEGAA